MGTHLNRIHQTYLIGLSILGDKKNPENQFDFRDLKVLDFIRSPR